MTELYRETQRKVTAPSEWQAFLAAACRNYRLTFDEQLLVYAQRPDATAVLEIERWNRQFGRWVNRGANGIAVFDGEHNGKPRLKYYFDISDTHEARFPRPVPLWTVREEYAPDIIETLENSFGELEHKEDLGEALLSAAKNAVEDNMPDYLSELKTLTEGSFLEGLDELNLEVKYRRAVQNSIGYMLLVKVIPESKVAAMRAGEVDFIIGSDTLDANSYQELSQTEGITGIISDFNFVTEFIALNDEIAPLDDQNVRTAIQMAIDKESIAQNIYAGLRTAANSVMPTDMPYCDATVTTPDYDMAGAIALLEDSGWVDSDGDGIREKDGKVLSFTITYPSTGVYDNVVLFFQSAMEELGIEIKTNPIDLMAFMQQVFMEDNYEMTAYMSYWFPYDPYTFVANMYPSTDYSDPSGIYSTDPQVAKALATMSDEEAKALIAGLYNTDDPAVVQEIFTEALNSANESSVIIPLNYRNEYAVFNSDVIESYTFNSIPNHVDVAAIHLK